MRGDATNVLSRALLLAYGCSPDRIESVMGKLFSKHVPPTPGEVLDQIEKAIMEDRREQLKSKPW